MKLKKYRVVQDCWLGYEAQVWRVWWPFWVQMWEGGITNTHSSVEEAKEFIERRRAGIRTKPNRHCSVVWTEV